MLLLWKEGTHINQVLQERHNPQGSMVHQQIAEARDGQDATAYACGK